MTYSNYLLNGVKRVGVDLSVLTFIDDISKYRADQPRDSRGRFASTHASVEESQGIGYRAGMEKNWAKTEYKLSAVGTKILPAGWDYVPTEEATEFLANYLYGSSPSADRSVATKYYSDLSAKGEIEVYKHSSGLVFTVENKDVNLPEKVKFETMQAAVELYTGNKANVSGDLLIRMDTASTDLKRTTGYAGDYRHSGNIFVKNAPSRTGSIKTIDGKTVTSKMIVLNGREIESFGDSGMKLTLSHEFGHILSYESSKSAPTSDKFLSWDKTRNSKSRLELSEYSRKSSGEWYAETFMIWVMNGGKFTGVKYLRGRSDFDYVLISDANARTLDNFAKDQGWKMPAVEKG